MVQIYAPQRVAAFVVSAGTVAGVGASGQGAGRAERARFAGTRSGRGVRASSGAFGFLDRVSVGASPAPLGQRVARWARSPLWEGVSGSQGKPRVAGARPLDRARPNGASGLPRSSVCPPACPHRVPAAGKGDAWGARNAVAACFPVRGQLLQRSRAGCLEFQVFTGRLEGHFRLCQVFLETLGDPFRGLERMGGTSL